MPKCIVLHSRSGCVMRSPFVNVAKKFERCSLWICVTVGHIGNWGDVVFILRVCVTLYGGMRASAVLKESS